MKNILLSQLICSLDLKERQEARRWLCSPIHNEREEAVRLYDFLQEYFFELSLVPTREHTFKKLYPNRPFNDQTLRLACTYLYQCLEEWLAWREWKKEKDTSLLRAYRIKGMNKPFHRQEHKYRRELDRGELQHHAIHFARYQLEHEKYLWQSRQGRVQAYNFQQQDNALQLAFMSYKLRLACLSVAHQQVSDAQYELAMLPELLALAEKSPYREHPAVSIYYFVYKISTDPDAQQAFKQLEALLDDQLHHFPEGEKRDLILLGINFCIRQINKKGNAFFKEALNLYRKGLEERLLWENGWLTAFTFSNITIIALRSGEVAWASSFVNDYKSQLAPHQRESIHALNEARIAYHNGDYRAALLALHRFTDRDFFHQMSAKILQLKIYFEEESAQLLNAHIKNTRAFLRRHKRDAYQEQIYTNIFYLTEQLTKLPPRDAAKKEQLQRAIETTEPLTERQWLLAQLEKV